ncbi:hypothetical protein CsSME_00051484 [Camellia sinensis var. sinensis]
MAYENAFDLNQALTIEGNSIHETKVTDPSPPTQAQKMSCLATIAASATGVCMVCMEGFKRGTTGERVPSCGHVYHKTCIANWLSNHNSCPLCRCQISDDQ